MDVGPAAPPEETAVPMGAVLVGLFAFLVALAGVPAHATYGARTTGDEPYYLLTALSLAEDASLDISDELADQRYWAFHETVVDRQTVPRGPDGRRVSPHDPGLPVLLAPVVTWGGWVGAKIWLALLSGGVAALTLLVAVRRGVPQPVAMTVVAAGFAGLPLAGYGTQIYPEVPAAGLVMLAIWALAGGGRARGAVVVASVVGLCWLSSKYLPVAAVLGLALVADRRATRRRLIGVIVVFVGSGLFYLAAHRWWYGGWTAYASGDHFVEGGEFSVVGRGLDAVGRSRRLVGLLVDRGFGLAAWSPFWLLLPVAMGAAGERAVRGLRRGQPDRVLLTLIAVVAGGWATATFVALTMHGWWMPGRQVVVVLPAALVLVSELVAWPRRSRVLLWFVASSGVVGLATWLWLAVEASTGRRTLVVDLGATAAPTYRWLAGLWPDGMAGGVSADVGLLVWAVVFALATVGGVIRERATSPLRRR